MAEQARRNAERDAVTAWAEGEPDVVITSFGGMAPEQWWGSVAGHSFYFRERHEQWEIELDLRPTGRTVRVWRGGDGRAGDEDSAEDSAGLHDVELRDIERGDVIAEGVVTEAWFGEPPLDRAQFIVRTSREHLERQECDVHPDRLGTLQRALGSPPGWCPACGT